MPKLKFFPRSVFGRTLWYPACDQSRAFLEAFEVKALSIAQMATLTGGGVLDVDVVQDGFTEASKAALNAQIKALNEKSTT